MAIRIQCECGKALKAPDSAARKKAKCPFCQRTMVVPQLGPLLGELTDVDRRLETTRFASASFAPESSSIDWKRFLLWVGIPAGAVVALLLYLGITASLRPGSRRSTADVAIPAPIQSGATATTGSPKTNGDARGAPPAAADESVPESMI